MNEVQDLTNELINEINTGVSWGVKATAIDQSIMQSATLNTSNYYGQQDPLINTQNLLWTSPSPTDPLTYSPYTTIPGNTGYQFNLPMTNSFENVIDTLFSIEEKLGFLLSIGYTKYNDTNVSKNDTTYDINSVFLFEISIKFKAILLTGKPNLTFKMPKTKEDETKTS